MNENTLEMPNMLCFSCNKNFNEDDALGYVYSEEDAAEDEDVKIGDWSGPVACPFCESEMIRWTAAGESIPAWMIVGFGNRYN